MGNVSRVVNCQTKGNGEENGSGSLYAEAPQPHVARHIDESEDNIGNHHQADHNEMNDLCFDTWDKTN